MPRASTRKTAAPADDERMTEFAWGVAHQFGNLVQVILGFAQLIRTQRPNDPELMDEIAEIITASGRAKGLVEQLLILSHRHAVSPAAVDVRQLVQRLKGALADLAGSEVTVELAGGDGPLMAAADAAGMERILLQMASCARCAMPKGGTLTIETAPADGGRVRLTVRDTGEGFDAEAAGRLFEPFYLKKRFGYGDGLDLAVAKELMALQEGTIDAETAPGRGTAYHLTLPGASGRGRQ